MKNKILFTILIVLIIIVIIVNVLVFGNSDKKSGSNLQSDEVTVVNNNPSFSEDKIVNNLLFTNIKGIYDGEVYVLSYTIINQSDEVIHMGDFILIIKDKDGKEITRVDYNYDYDLKSGQEYPTSHFINDNIIDAYSIEYIVNN